MRTTYSTTRTVQKGQSNQQALLGLLLNIDLLDSSLTADGVRVLLYMHANGFEKEYDSPSISEGTRIHISSLYYVLRKLEEKEYITYSGVRGSRKQSKSQLTSKGITFCRDVFRPQTI
jgi:hypothetical protein